MELIGQIIIYIMMVFLIIGAIASIFNDTKGFGKEFKEGIHSIGPIFLTVAGVMSIIPLLSYAISHWLGPIYAWIHADPSLAAGLVIAPDLGAYKLAAETAGSHAAWIFAFALSFITGSTIIFVVPVGLAMLGKRDHKYMALGIMAGLLSVPISVIIIVLMLQFTQVPLRTEISTNAASTRPFDMPIGEIMLNMVPIVLFVVVLALGLRLLTTFMVRAFIVFGKILDIVIRLALAASIVEYFTGVFDIFGKWPLAPIIADADDQYRALEVAGAVGIMLAGAFPMVYAIRTWLSKPLAVAGKRFGFSEQGAAGILAGAANVLALMRIIPLMPARDKVVTIAFGVCAAFTFGDHLAFSANFQPNMVAAIIVGKLVGGLFGIVFAVWLAVPYAKRLEQLDPLERKPIDMDGLAPKAGAVTTAGNGAK